MAIAFTFPVAATCCVQDFWRILHRFFEKARFKKGEVLLNKDGNAKLQVDAHV